MTDRLADIIQDIKDCNPDNWHKPEFMADSLLVNGVIVQKQGEWVSCGLDNNDMEIIKCSECGRKQFGYSKFCAACGAKMKEREGK